jgi:hypothetical protein
LTDKSTQLVLDALGRAAADPAGVPLHGGKAAPGLFATGPLARQAAQRCKDEGFLRVVGTETRGKAVHEVCALTDKGLAYLLSQVSPRRVLEDLVRALEARQGQVGELVAAAQRTRADFEALRATAEQVLHRVQQPAQAVGPAPSGNGCSTGTAALLTHLGRWQASGASEDCPLPELYRRARQELPGLTVGHFHDDLRRLHEQEQVYLHPWTGPLYDLPEPPYALLVGHEIAYYASLRR